jgi:hypothetical protein
MAYFIQKIETLMEKLSLYLEVSYILGAQEIWMKRKDVFYTILNVC